MEPRAGKPTARAYEAFVNGFERDLLLRFTADIIAMSPPLIIEKSEIDRLFEGLADILRKLD